MVAAIWALSGTPGASALGPLLAARPEASGQIMWVLLAMGVVLLAAWWLARRSLAGGKAQWTDYLGQDAREGAQAAAERAAPAATMVGSADKAPVTAGGHGDHHE